MIAYILIGIGAWLIYDDIKHAKRNKITKVLADAENFLPKGGQDGIHENGNDSSSRDSSGKSRAVHQESDRAGGIGIPVKAAPNTAVKAAPNTAVKKSRKEGATNDVSKKPVHKSESDKNGNRVRDDSNGKPDAASRSDQVESLTKGGQNAGHQINSENGNSDNGDDVGAESISGAESDSP